MNWKGKTVIVTGAAGGIGAALCHQLLEQGARVVATDLEKPGGFKNREGADTLVPAHHDVRSESDWKKVLELADLPAFPLYGLVNAAGVLKPGYCYQSSAADIDFHMDVNFKGLALGCTLFSTRLVKAGRPAHIINLASLAGVAPIPGISLYSASKFAVRGYSLAIAAELSSHKIEVTVVCPDAVATPMLDLQVHHEEAALTFSGGEPLSAAEVAETICRAFEKPEKEITLPGWRGALAKISNLAPGISDLMLEPLKNIGLKNQKKIRG